MQGERIVVLLILGVLGPAAAHAADSTSSTKREAKDATRALPSLPASASRPGLHGAVSLTRQTPFGQAVDILRNSTTPPLNIVVLWKPLADSAGIHRDTPIGMDGVSGLRAGQILDLLTLSLSAGASAKIGYTIDKGIITISTVDTLPTPKPVVRVYDISDLIAAPARYSPITSGVYLGYGGFMPSTLSYPANPANTSTTIRQGPRPVRGR